MKLKVDLPLVPTFNQMLRMHWGKRSRIKRDIGWTIKAAPGRQSWQQENPYPLRCQVDIIRKTTGRAPDPDNLVASAKLILDALVDLQIILDDTPDHLELNVSWEHVKKKDLHAVSVEVSVIS